MQYKREKCNRDGEQVTNLSEEEQRGLKSLMKKIKEDKILIMKTDKSGKLAVTTKEKYTEMGMEHVGKDSEVGRQK